MDEQLQTQGTDLLLYDICIVHPPQITMYVEHSPLHVAIVRQHVFEREECHQQTAQEEKRIHRKRGVAYGGERPAF